MPRQARLDAPGAFHNVSERDEEERLKDMRNLLEEGLRQSLKISDLPSLPLKVCEGGRGR